MKNLKKTLCLLLCLIMVVGLVPTTHAAGIKVDAIQGPKTGNSPMTTDNISLSSLHLEPSVYISSLTWSADGTDDFNADGTFKGGKVYTVVMEVALSNDNNNDGVDDTKGFILPTDPANIPDFKVSVNGTFETMTKSNVDGKLRYTYTFPATESATPTTYTVTFDSNSGSTVASQTVESGKTATKPADPTKEGYTFKGWTYKGSPYDFSKPVAENITLYARWGTEFNITEIVLPNAGGGIDNNDVRNKFPSFSGFKYLNSTPYYKWYDPGASSLKVVAGVNYYAYAIMYLEDYSAVPYEGDFVVKYAGTELSKISSADIYTDNMKSGYRIYMYDTDNVALQVRVYLGTPAGTGATYNIIAGANGEYQRGSAAEKLSFTADGDFSKFIGVDVDGSFIDITKYDAISGSTIVDLKKAYLESLPVGEHTLEIKYYDGTASTKFYIKAAADTPAVTGITVDPTSTTVEKGTTQQFTATVSGTGLFDTGVLWAVTGGTGSTISSSGLLTVGAGETAATLTVTATAAGDTSKKASAAVTVKSPGPVTYTATVENGTGGGDYASGATVTVTADTIPGKLFREWTTSDGVTFTDSKSATTTFTMPDKDVTVTAVYDTVISVIEISGIAEPVAGAVPSDSFTISTAGVEVGSNTFWQVYDEATNTLNASYADSKIVNNEPFRAGTYVKLQAEVIAKEGYVFTPDTVIRYNGVELPAKDDSNLKPNFRYPVLAEHRERTAASIGWEAKQAASETINVTYDYESKEDVVKQFAKGVSIYDAAVESAPPADTKPGYVFHQWDLSADTPLENLSEPENPSSTKIIGDVTFVPHWYKYYDEIHFSFSGYEIGANIADGVLTDDIDGYAPLDFPEIWGGKNFVIVADKDGIPDMTDPSIMLKVVTGAFEENKDYWLAVLIGGEGRDITGDIVLDAYDIEDYFLDSPDCIDKYRIAEGEAEIAFFKLKPLEVPETTTYTVTFDSNGGSAVTAQNVESGKTATKPTDPTKAGYTFKGWYLGETAYDFATPVTGDITLKAKWEKIETPTDPTDPTEPSKPTDPTDPTEPSKPTDPTEPTEPGKPTDPTEPTEPGKPTDPADPTEPSKPTTPTTPTNPEIPETGDNSNMFLWIAMLFASFFGVVMALVLKKKSVFAR